MNQAQKAKRATITVAGIEIEAFELPNGERVLSQTQVGRAIHRGHSSLDSFLKSKQAKALLGKRFSLATMQIEGNNALF